MKERRRYWRPRLKRRSTKCWPASSRQRSASTAQVFFFLLFYTRRLNKLLLDIEKRTINNIERLLRRSRSSLTTCWRTSASSGGTRSLSTSSSSSQPSLGKQLVQGLWGYFKRKLQKHQIIRSFKT